MFQRIMSATGRRRPQYWGSVALRLLLLVVAWQGPIAWFHCHGSLAGVNENQTWLAKHLQTHHPGVPLFSTAHLGWHFHFELPSPSSEDGEKDAPQPCVDVSPLRPLTLVEADAGCSSFQSFVPLVPNLLRLPRPRLAAAELAQHFFDGFADSLPLPLRFCIALN
jgi:hypothetical protein